MAYYNYAKHCGCGNSRCNNGWIYWSGSEYPCNWCEQQQRKEAETLEEEAEERDEEESSNW